MATITLSPKKGAGCLILFALPFAAVGVGATAWIIWDLVTYQRAQGWEEVPAVIVRAELESHSGGDGGPTYEATADYTYQYKGRQYAGSRVSFSTGSDNVGSFQQNTHRTLKKHQKSGEPFRCYVNPSDPTEAVLFRGMRWEMIGFKALFAVMFGAFGFILLGCLLFSRRKTKQDKKMAALWPDEPWRWKKAWADGRIRSSTGPIVLFAIGFTFFWNVFSWPISLVAINDPSFNKHEFAILVLIFPLVGIFLMIWALVAVLRWRKYGRTMFEMASVPGVIGGQLAGVIRVPAKVRTEDAFLLKLTCVRKTISGQGKSNHISEHTLWEDEQRIAQDLLRRDPEKTAIPVLFQIPYKCKPTDESDENNEILWKLTASAKTPGLDFSTSFDVPVFKTDESDPDFVVDRELIKEYSVKEDPDRDLREAGVRKTISPTGEGIRLVFPMARTPGMASILTLMGCVFGAVPVVMYHLEAPLIANIIFGVVFGAFGLLFFLGGVETWFYRSVVDVSRSKMTVAGGLFGFGRPRRITASEIEKFVPKSRMSSGQGQSKKTYYDIDVILASGKKITAGKRILGKRLVESVIRQIEQELGIEKSD